MKIFINGKFLIQRKTGVQRYALGIIKELQQCGFSFIILVPPGTNVPAGYHYRVVSPFVSSFFWEQITLPVFLLRQQDAFLINLCNAAPLLLKQQAVTIHDLAFEQRGVRWFSTSFRLWYRFMVPNIIKRSKTVFTVSGFSKQEIITHYHIPSEKITVVPNGHEQVDIQDNNIEAFPVKQPYLLFVGGENPRKNIDFVYNALSEIKAKGFSVVVLSNSHLIFEPALSQKDSSVIHFSNANDALYYQLIKRASALVYPSFYEGFGIPVLDALRLRVPVICSDLSVFRESFSGLPIYVELNDSDSLKKALNKLSSWHISEQDVEHLNKTFNFNRSALILMDVLRSKQIIK